MKREKLLIGVLAASICLLLMSFMAGCDGGGAGLNPGSTVHVDTNAACCSDCICRGSAPTQSSSTNGNYGSQSYQIPRTIYPAGATVYHPRSATPPFAALVYCPPFMSPQAVLAPWGPFMASHGIVVVTMNTTTIMDQVDKRDDQQRRVLEALKQENTRSGGPLYGKLSNRYGVMGWSMGGGATWINAATVRDLKSAMSLAGHNLTAGVTSKGRGIMCPTLLFNGATDNSILGGMGQSTGVFSAIPDGIPKIIYEVSGAGHFSWGTPTQAGPDVAKIALAFQKTFLEGDTRWAKFLVVKPDRAATFATNIAAD